MTGLPIIKIGRSFVIWNMNDFWSDVIWISAIILVLGTWLKWF